MCKMLNGDSRQEIRGSLMIKILSSILNKPACFESEEQHFIISKPKNVDLSWFKGFFISCSLFFLTHHSNSFFYHSVSPFEETQPWIHATHISQRPDQLVLLNQNWLARRLHKQRKTKYSANLATMGTSLFQSLCFPFTIQKQRNRGRHDTPWFCPLKPLHNLVPTAATPDFIFSWMSPEPSVQLDEKALN